MRIQVYSECSFAEFSLMGAFLRRGFLTFLCFSPFREHEKTHGNRRWESTSSTLPQGGKWRRVAQMTTDSLPRQRPVRITIDSATAMPCLDRHWLCHSRTFPVLRLAYKEVGLPLSKSSDNNHERNFPATTTCCKSTCYDNPPIEGLNTYRWTTSL